MSGLGWLWVVVMGCQAPLPDPTVDAVSPDVVYNGDLSALTILGEDFYPTVEIDARSRQMSAAVNTGFQVRLEGPLDAASPSVVLREASFTDLSTLNTSIDAGLRPGDYDVVVVAPGGREGVLSRGLRVTDVLADRLTVTAPDLLVQVNRTAYVTVELLDREGDRVPEDFGVELEILDADGEPVPVVFEAGGLQQQESASATVVGALREGVAVVGFVPTEPGVVTVYARETVRSGVASGEANLLVTTGDEFEVVVDLPSEPLAVQAGEDFQATLTLVDQFGNLVDNRPQLVLVGSSCGDWATTLTLSGSATLDVLLQRATNTTACPEQRLNVLGAVSGKSTPIDVQPGPPVAFTVETSTTSLVAGNNLVVSARPVDTFGNRTVWGGNASSDIEVEDSAGGLRNVSCSGTTFASCLAQVVRAGPGITVTVTDASRSLSGTSAPYLVEAGEPDKVVVGVSGDEHVAGQGIDVELAVLDAFDNLVPTELLTGELSVASAVETPVCAPASGPSDAVWRTCTLTKARTLAVLEAQYNVEGRDPLADSSEAFTVVNGPLRRVAVTPLAGAVDAGAPLDVQLDAFDAFDNPYLVHADALVQLADTSQTWSVDSAVLDASGAALVSGTFQRAGQTEVIASQGGAELGRSSPVVVLPGDTVGASVTAPAWAWTGEPVAVKVAATDAFGNTADYDGEALLSAASGAVVDVPVALVNGVGEVDVVWASVVADERIDVDLDGLTASSERFPVATRCADGPEVQLKVDDLASDALVCLDEHDAGSVDVDLTDSTPFPGTTLSALLAYGDRDQRGGSSGDTFPLGVDGLGSHLITGFVMQSDGCGFAATTTVWAGRDDGRATGPLAVFVVDDPVDLGASTVGRVLDVQTCAGDPAADAEVRVRTTAGEISGVVSTGSGLALTLDGGGDGSFSLDFATTSMGGPAVVSAWAPGGSAKGRVELEVVGDLERPQVWEMSPSGNTTEPISVIEVLLSEPAAGVSTSDVAVNGPSTVLLSDVRLEGDGRRVVLVPTSAIDPTLGTWQVTLRSSLTDEAGNALDGRWGGTAANFVGTFGALPSSASPVSACGVAPSRFSPDGDFGEGDQVDEVEVSFESAAAPAWWVVTVSDSAGERLRRDRVVPLDAVDSWSWDGRDGAGRIVNNGSYRIEVDTDDGLGNAGGACTVSATVGNVDVTP